MEISNNGISYYVQKKEFESNDLFHKRMWFIVNQNPTNSKELEKAIDNSIIWVNINFLNCIYDKNIHININKLQKQYYSTL